MHSASLSLSVFVLWVFQAVRIYFVMGTHFSYLYYLNDDACEDGGLGGLESF